MRLTDTLNWYYITTNSSQPTYQAGDIVFVSHLKKPERDKYICFKIDQSYLMHRCMALPGDVIELKDGVVYRNGQKLNENYITNEYIVPTKTTDSLQNYFISNHIEVTPYQGLLSRVSLSKADIEKLQLENLKKLYLPKGVDNSSLNSEFSNKGYNEDNFGPVKVPSGCYFVLGDNRHNAMDSRYVGFIKPANLTGAILN